MNAPTQVPSKAMLVNDMSRFLIVELPAPVTFDARKEIAQRLAAALERPAHEPCPGCAEFVRMQHDIASLLGVDADTDSIDLHGRIYGALSTRAAQPPGPGEFKIGESVRVGPFHNGEYSNVMKITGAQYFCDYTYGPYSADLIVRATSTKCEGQS